MRRRVCLTIWGVYVLAMAAHGQAPKLDRWAILAAPKIPETDLADLLTVKLAAEPGVTLVERDQIAAALKELTLDQALGADAAGQRLKLGRLLKADALILLADEQGPNIVGAGKSDADDQSTRSRSTAEDPDSRPPGARQETAGEHRSEQRFVRVVICDATCGARLCVEFLPLEKDQLDKLAADLAARVREVRQRYPAGVQRIIGVPHFLSRNLTQEYDQLQTQLAYVLESAFAGLPGTAVLETEEAQAIRRELEIGGTEPKHGVVPLFVEGEYRVTGTQAAGDRAFELKLRVTDGKGELRTLEQKLPTVEKVVAYLREQAPAAALALTGEAARSALSVEQQVALLAARADTFGRLASYELAIDLRETCLLIKPDDVTQALALLDDYCRFVEPHRAPGRGSVTEEERYRQWSKRLSAWPRSLEILEHLVRRGLISQSQALDRHARLREVLEGFVAVIPGTDDRYLLVPAELESVLAVELPKCTAVHRAFLLGVGPVIRRLEPGVREFPAGDGMVPDARQTLYLRWLETMLAWPAYQRRGPSELRFKREMLERYRDVLTTLAENLPVPDAAVFRFIGEAVRCPAETREFTPDELRSFLDALAHSQLRMTQFYGRYGLVLFDHYLRPEGERTAAQATIEALRALQMDLRAYVERAFQRSVGFERTISELEKSSGADAAPVRQEAAPAGQEAVPARKAASVPPTSAAPKEATHPATAQAEKPPDRLRYERVRLIVRRKSGDQQNYEKLRWSEMPSFVEEWGPPSFILRVGTQFDVLYNGWCLLWHREPGYLDEVVTDKAPGIFTAAWDGERVWLATRNDGIWLLSPTGELVAKIGKAHGLPPADVGIRLAALAPGRALVVGSFGKTRRAWCAVVEVGDGQPRVDVIHEATHVYAEADDTRWPNNYAAAVADPEWGFAPRWVYLWPDPLAGGRSRVLVEREEAPWNGLLLDPESRKVEPIDLGQNGRAGQGPKGYYLFLSNGDYIAPLRTSIWYCTYPGRERDGRVATRLAWTRLTEAGAGGFDGLPLLLGGYVYIAGARWVRFDPETLKTEALGAGRAQGSDGLDMDYSVSAHFGLVAWDADGRFYRVSVAEPGVAASSTGVPMRGVRVLDASSQQPLADVSVYVEAFAGNAVGRTDGSGTCLPDALGATDEAMITLQRPGFEPQLFIPRNHRDDVDSGGVFTAALAPLLTLGGLVQDAEGKPIAAARVALALRLPDQYAGAPRTDYEVATDAEGQWRAAIFPADLSNLHVSVTPSSPNHANAAWQRLGADSIEELRELRYVTVLAAATTLIGKVIDSTGGPVSGAEVRLVQDTPIPMAVTQETRSGPDGVFRFGNPPRRACNLLVRAPGFAVQCQAVQIGGGVQSVEVHLEPQRTVQGKVTDADGQPIAGARVTVADWHGTKTLVYDTTTDAEGRFTWDNCPFAAVLLSASKPGYGTASAPAPSDLSTECVIRLQPVGRRVISGTVSDAETTKPLPGFTLRYAELRERLRPSGAGKPIVERFSEGAYRLPLKSDKDVHFWFEADGYIPQIHKVSAGSEGQVELNVALARGEGPTGIVQLPDGTPASRVEVVLVAPDQHPMLSGLQFGWEGLASTTSDEKGQFAFPAQPEGFLLVVASANGYAEVSNEQSAVDHRLVIRPWGRIEGVCRVGRKGGAGESVSWTWPSKAIDWHAPCVSMGGSTTSGEGGLFVFERVPEGEHLITRDVTQEGSTHSSNKVLVRVAGGQTTHVEIRPEGRPVIGRVVVSPGAAGHGKTEGTALVGHLNEVPAAQQPSHARAETARAEQELRWYPLQIEPDGVFLADDVAPGMYYVYIYTRGSPPTIIVDSKVTVPPPAPGNDGPIDLGVLTSGPDTSSRPAPR